MLFFLAIGIVILFFLPSRLDSPSPLFTPTIAFSPTPSPTPIPPTQTPTPTLTPTPTPIPVTSFESYFDEYSQKYAISKDLLKKIALCESGFNAQATNGPYGGMYQFTSQTWSSTRNEMGLDQNPELRFDAKTSIETAAFKISRGGENAWLNCK